MTIKKLERTIYVCSDDSEFSDENAALAHEAVIESGGHIEEFLETQAEQYKPKTITMIRGILKDYVAFRAKVPPF